MGAATFDVSDGVLEILRRCEITQDRVVLPEGDLDRKIYMAVDKVLKAAGGKWNRKAKAHLFERDPREILKDALEFGFARDVKKELQAYYTPPALARLVIKLARLTCGNKILEPSAGDGALVVAAIEADPWAQLWCYDIDPLAIEKLGDRLQSNEVKNREPVLVEEIDFLKLDPLTGLDRVIMNPPFANNQDTIHVVHALRFLGPGGILVALVPSGIEGLTKRHQEFWELIRTKRAHKLYDVPEGAFKSSGTQVRTKILTVRV